ncbi:MAG: peptidylprolyl isomerase [Pseudorhodoplanes sp.]|nr:putative parvulin-type peptidyl-prolyl cis-trans isomerase [Pseudorhodoplanes sp.]MCQ3942430.1 peptidylprolyl isomerase [Alphaproteobacteria bacterium]MBW7949805.1 peptidylprolyl isomerase [Pseudorhodoplanes sp.]MCL4710115.1 peptidylprolyl isomerase [Pseudorhodoplanes sp.]MCZ7643376.1 peptidylprolyl isomerase [Pseudorhodoplanes sp.]
MTRLFAKLAFAALLAVAVAIPAQTQAQAQNDPVVAKVNGTEIRQSDLNAAEEEIGQNIQAMPAEARREYLITFVTDMVVLAKAAEARKLGDTAEFKRKLELARTRLLMETLLQAEAKTAVTDAAMKKVYEEATKQMGDEKEVRARHILVEKEDEAKAILADLKQGKDFAAIAKEKSKDPGSKENGGDLGYFTKEQMVSEFAEIAFKLEKGQLSDPVKTQFGWHVLKVEDKRNRPVPEFDKVKDQVQSFVIRKAQADLVTKLRGEAKIEKMTPPADAKPADQKK